MNKAFAGTIETVYSGNSGPQAIVNHFLVIDQNDNVVGAPPSNTVLSQSTVPLSYHDDIASIQRKVRDDIRAQYQDPTLQVIFINGLGGLLNF
jgi:hypothetical protein